MLLNSTKQYIAFALVALALFGFLAYELYPRVVLAQKIQTCSESMTSEAHQIDCWQSIVRDTFDSGGTAAAFDVFELIYKQYDVFARTGCHRHAHRVGDMSYYFDYLSHRNLDEVEFPTKAHLCGYGFYHGFVEHLVQDNPDAEFVTQTCTKMIDRLSDNVAPAIQQTCYHGAGHGFLLAQADTLVDSTSWTVRAFLEKPLQLCESLTQVREYDREECRQGVYNVFTDWMFDGEYDFVFDTTEPFKVCHGETEHRRPDCYYEVAQKLDSVSGQSPARIIEIASPIDEKRVRDQVISTGVAGIVQHDPSGTQESILAECRESVDDFALPCIRGIVGGLVEHDISGSNYMRAVNFCTDRDMSNVQRESCFKTALTHMERFRTVPELKDMCTRDIYPEGFCTVVANRTVR